MGILTELSILFVGIGSIFNFEKGLSVAAVIQITDMIITDILLIGEKSRKPSFDNFVKSHICSLPE